MIRTPQTFFRLCRLLWGEHWHAPAADQLRRTRVTMYRWEQAGNDAKIPSDAWRALEGEVQSRVEAVLECKKLMGSDDEFEAA